MVKRLKDSKLTMWKIIDRLVTGDCIFCGKDLTITERVTRIHIPLCKKCRVQYLQEEADDLTKKKNENKPKNRTNKNNKKD